MQFANASISALLVLPLIFFILALVADNYRKRLLNRCVEQSLQVAVVNNLDSYNGSLARKRLIRSLIFFLLVVALLRPQWGYKLEERTLKGVDVAIALDISESMLSEDVKPNRLKLAKRKIFDLLEELRGDRVALVAFAGRAFIQVPLTEDYSAVRMFLNDLNPSMTTAKGTNIAAAIFASLKILKHNMVAQDEKNIDKRREQAILLITDGEEFTGDIENAAEAARKAGARVYILGVGTTQGAPIPAIEGGFKKDRQGNIVITKLDIDVLSKLASDTGGVFVRAITGSKDLLTIYDLGIKQTLEESELKGGKVKRWNESYQPVVLLAILLLLIEPVFLICRNKKGSMR